MTAEGGPSGDARHGGTWEFSVRAISGQIEPGEAPVHTHEEHHAGLSAGIDVNPFAEQVGPLANWRTLSETGLPPH
jgi:hypothetical protein